MSRHGKRASLIAIGLGLLVSRASLAEDEPEPHGQVVPPLTDVVLKRAVEVPPPRRPERPPLGLEVMAGGGVTGFVDHLTRDVADIGGMWTVRLVVGPHRTLGFDLAYVGSAQDVGGLGASATVLGTGVEATARLNFTRTYWVQPFLFAGAGWTRYRLGDADLSRSSLDRDDDLLVLPGGAGLSLWITPRFTIDLRETYRLAIDDDMFDQPGASGDGMDSWSIAGQVGLAF